MPGKYFAVEIAITKYSDKFGPLDGPETSHYYATNRLDEFVEYVHDAKAYFSSMVRFESNTKAVSLLCRIDRDHHSLTIYLDNDGNVRIR
jgi:hypothetical protein